MCLEQAHFNLRSKIALTLSASDTRGMTRASENNETFPGAQSTGEGAERRCQWDGCLEAGAYRAPTDKTLSEYYVFCLEHVRAYNAQWNYHDGMGADEMEQEYRSAATWDRPTWKLGTRHAPGRPWHGVYDPFEVFREGPSQHHHAHGDQGCGDTSQAQALKTLGLNGLTTLSELKSRYKDLVKRHHPDANGGAEDAENKMKVINAAYHTLLATFAK